MSEFADGTSPAFDEIDPDEVETVVEALDDLIEEVKNETVKMYLHAACDDIARLVMWDDEEDESAAA